MILNVSFRVMFLLHSNDAHREKKMPIMPYMNIEAQSLVFFVDILYSIQCPFVGTECPNEQADIGLFDKDLFPILHIDQISLTKSMLLELIANRARNNSFKPLPFSKLIQQTTN